VYVVSESTLVTTLALDFVGTVDFQAAAGRAALLGGRGGLAETDVKTP